MKLGNNIPKNKLSKNKNLKSQNALKILNKLYTQARVKVIYCGNSAAVNLQWRFSYQGDIAVTLKAAPSR